MEIINPLFFALPSGVRGQIQEMDAMDEIAFIAQGTQRELALYCQSRTIHFNRDGTGFMAVERGSRISAEQLIRQVFRWKAPDCLIASTTEAMLVLHRLEEELKALRLQDENEQKRREAFRLEQDVRKAELQLKYGNAKGTKGMVRVSIDNPKQGVQVQELPGELFGEFAIHKDLDARTTWVITHRESGKAAARFPLRQAARSLAARLNDLVAPGSDVHEVVQRIGALVRQARNTNDVFTLV